MNLNQPSTQAVHRPRGRFIPNPKLKLQDQLAEVFRFKPSARTYDEATAKQLITDRAYAALDQIVIEHLLGK